VRSPEQRARKWLRVYPRAYRERRGEELLATLLDKARDNPRIPTRELVGVFAHAGSMRVRQLRVVPIALVIAVVGAGLGAAIGFWTGPSGYAATVTVTPARFQVRNPSLRVSTDALRALSTHFIAFRRTDPGITPLLERGLSAPYPRCSVLTVETANDRGVQLTCTAASAPMASRAVGDQAAVFGVMYRQEIVSKWAHSLALAGGRIRDAESQIALIRHEIATTRNPILRGGLEHEFNLQTDKLYTSRQLANVLLARLAHPEASLGFVGGGPNPIYDITGYPLLLGAWAGLALALIVGTTRRRPASRQPIPA
jgi:hypothetical protein